MDQGAKKFAFTKRDLKISETVQLDKDDVGILESENSEIAKIFFIHVWDKVTLSKNEFEIFDVKHVGDAFPKKICNVCHKLLSTNQFQRNQNGINNRPIRRPTCNTCRKILEGMSMGLKVRSSWLKNKPDLVPFECPICGKRTIAGVTSKVVLDHNHRTGEARAWICDSCNTGIGRFKDDIVILQRAIEFLSRDKIEDALPPKNLKIEFGAEED